MTLIRRIDLCLGEKGVAGEHVPIGAYIKMKGGIFFNGGDTFMKFYLGRDEKRPFE